MLSSSRRLSLLVIALLLFIPIGFLQTQLIDPFYNKNYAPPKQKNGVNGLSQAGSNLPATFALGAFTGFREAIAGMLWVRCDEFFHNGDYDAIMPLIRIITWLDPHQIDVYMTGAWHMDYNFTDSQERSDRRYIPLSVALLKEGIDNNEDQPDLYSDMAFVHYFRKIQDFPQSRYWFEKGWNVVSAKAIVDEKNDQIGLKDQSNFDGADKGVMTVGHGYAHALEFNGQEPEAVKQWQACIDLHQKLIAVKGGKDISETQNLEIADKQLSELQGRLKYRPIDTKVPLDMGFRPQLVRVAPKVFVLQGSLNAIGARKFILETGAREFGPVDGCRVEIRLQDETYKLPEVGAYTLGTTVDPNVTIMQDAASVRGGKIGGDQGRKIDMSQDKEMYSFKAPRYTVTAWFTPNNPNDAPIQVQDRIGWLGEGLDPKQQNFVLTDGKSLLPGEVSPIPGLRMLVKTWTLTREDITGAGKKVFN